MKKQINFPSIEQFRHVIAIINRKYNFIGLDENGDAIYDESLPKPVLTFKGTVKLHGTNAGVCFNNTAGIWAQSRENIITPQKDNAGFAFFVETNKHTMAVLFAQIVAKYGIDTSTHTISIYGEWVGKGIQSGVGVTKLEKSWFIFGVKISNLNDPESVAYWVDGSSLSYPEAKIYNINDFKTYEIEIDFNAPQLAQNAIIDMTIEVEDECPVAKQLGFPNEVGEGIVFSYSKDGEVYRFKSKGEKHSKKSKVKVLKPVDEDKIKVCMELAEIVTPDWRLEQMLSEEFDLLNGGTLDVKRLGNYIKRVMTDVVKEETDLMAEAGLEPKDLGKYISEIAKRYFFTAQNKEVGLA